MSHGFLIYMNFGSQKKIGKRDRPTLRKKVRSLLGHVFFYTRPGVQV